MPGGRQLRPHHRSDGGSCGTRGSPGTVVGSVDRVAAGRHLTVAFDVNETLFGFEPLLVRFSARGLPGPALEWWFETLAGAGVTARALNGNDRVVGRRLERAAP